MSEQYEHDEQVTHDERAGEEEAGGFASVGAVAPPLLLAGADEEVAEPQFVRGID